MKCFYFHKKGHYNYQCKELKQHLEDKKKEKKSSETTSVAEKKSIDFEVDADLLLVSLASDVLS